METVLGLIFVALVVGAVVWIRKAEIDSWGHSESPEESVRRCLRAEGITTGDEVEGILKRAEAAAPEKTYTQLLKKTHAEVSQRTRILEANTKLAKIIQVEREAVKNGTMRLRHSRYLLTLSRCDFVQLATDIQNGTHVYDEWGDDWLLCMSQLAYDKRYKEVANYLEVSVKRKLLDDFIKYVLGCYNFLKCEHYSKAHVKPTTPPKVNVKKKPELSNDDLRKFLEE
jgi:hypothetical protein